MIQYKKISNLINLTLLLLFLSGCGAQSAPLRNTPITDSDTSSISPGSLYGFSRADQPRTWVFPDDHGTHPDFQTEWWYYTGNLETAKQEKFGYQLTFFRRALLPAQQISDRRSTLATGQVYMAHLALTDANQNSHYEHERFQRGNSELAGAAVKPFRIWIDDLRVEEIQPGVYQLHSTDEEFSIDLVLKDLKGPILNGVNGLSSKGADPGQASYYYSQPRLESSGNIRIHDTKYAVNGFSWMDHEFSTSALPADRAGWDWFSIQLDDFREIMVFQIRNKDGSADNFSSGTIVRADGSTRTLQADDFIIKVLETWRSPASNTEYPAKWQLSIPSEKIVLDITPLIPDQEMNLSYVYWEGAVKADGISDGKSVNGEGYAELTGYAGAIGGEF